jgi:hypothetical protein
MFEPLAEVAAAPADNPTTLERVALGHKLFFEPKLSRSGTIACNTCHVVGAAGVDHRETAMGEGARVGVRNSPTVYNAAFLVAQFWDGRAPTLEEQAKGPIQAHVEMDLTPPEAVARLIETGYAPLFAEAFGGDSALTFDNVAKAIAAFERTLVTPEHPSTITSPATPPHLALTPRRALRSFSRPAVSAATTARCWEATAMRRSPTFGVRKTWAVLLSRRIGETTGSSASRRSATWR